MRAVLLVGLVGVALAIAVTTSARGQTRAPHPVTSQVRSTPHPTPDPLSPTSSLRARFGADAAARLMRSADPDERLRGVERAAGIETTSGLALLERAARASGPGALDPRLPDEGVARRDPRALLAVVRGLAQWTDDDGARAVLDEIVRAPNESFATRPPGTTGNDPAEDELRGASRVTLARQEAAIALATSGNPLALEHLVTASRSGGPGQDAALLALGVAPPSDPLTLGGVALTTPPIIALAGHLHDLRTLDPILGAVQASDPALRVAALGALASAGDTRAAEVARSALHDDDSRVRIAAADALARLAVPDAASAVEALVMDDTTALAGLRVAQHVQGEGVVKAAAARAISTSDTSIREAAFVALGRQTSPSAVRALVAAIAMPALQSDAACALARSPSAGALASLEDLAKEPATRRLAARAYFARRYLRGDRSERLDVLLAALVASADGLDRAVATEALVALGARTLDVALADADARVRRAAAMGALARREARSGATSGADDADAATRVVLAAGWMEHAPTEGPFAPPTSLLLERASAGGGDAPLAAYALARRTQDAPSLAVDTLLESADPLLRAQAWRGLEASRTPSATGRLADAYAWEGDASVRRAILGALAASPDATTRRVFLVAAHLDPDTVARWIAAAAASTGASAEGAPEAGYGIGLRDLAWLHAAPGETADAPSGLTGLLATSDGRAVPIVFDDEGYALVPGVSPGEARVRLAPRLPAYSPSSL